MKIPIPDNQYVRNFSVQGAEAVLDLAERKKVALVFISLNDRYWPYLGQVVKDCKQHFLKNHKVDYFVWTDYGEEGKKKLFTGLDALLTSYQNAPPEKKQETMGTLIGVFAQIVRLYEVFYPTQIVAAVTALQAAGMLFKRDGSNFWVEATRPITDQDVVLFHKSAKDILTLAATDLEESLKGVHVIDTEPVEWPSPTLMRYHLFLNEEEKLKNYDYIFYLDADMRVVSEVGDEVLGTGITAALHPMYALRKEYIPPYEPNPDSTAYIHRPGKVTTEEGKQRFQPYYYAGGFQGGPAQQFIEAMKQMKKNIDKDFDSNYISIWNDESHWNKYLAEKPPDIVLSPSYVYPDSLIKEYYEPLWGRSYEPKIITLTKPFTLSAQGAAEINKVINKS